MKTGQGNVSTYIAPGETLRTPLMAFVAYEDLTADEQTNAWRHYYINDVMPKQDGEHLSAYSCVGGMSTGLTTDKILLTRKSYQLHGVKPAVLWMDAGWYTGLNGEEVAWSQTGACVVSRLFHPHEYHLPQGA